MSSLPASAAPERHFITRIGWLRAAVLGANDGLLSVASLLVGVSAASLGRSQLIFTGVAGIVAGAMSMAAGEYVSVSSQSDTENADLARERLEIATDPEHEIQELASIYIGRGLTPELANQVAVQFTAHDALGAHARDELGINEIMTAQPIQAALASAGSFALGAALPILVVWLMPTSSLILPVASFSLTFLALLGGLAAKAGGANCWVGTVRVAFWGALAMAATAGVGSLFGVVTA